MLQDNPKEGSHTPTCSRILFARLITRLAAQGLDPRNAGSNAGKLFGCGTYLASLSSKSNEKGERCLLVVRACLGEPHMQNTPCRDILKPPERKDKRGPLSSVVALTVTQGGCVEHPEYIVYNQAQTLPQFAIYYKHTEECRCTHCWREVEYLNIRTVTQHGSSIFFKLKITTPFQKLMHAFCSRQGVSMSAVRFIFDGTDINETQTPAQLDMEDGDMIHVEVRQAASSSSAELITLRVIDEDGAEVYSRSNRQRRSRS